MAPEMHPSTHFGSGQWRQLTATERCRSPSTRTRLCGTGYSTARALTASLLAEWNVLQATSQRLQYAPHVSIAYILFIPITLPCIFTPRISSSFSFKPMPRSISRLPRQRLDGIDAHAAHHFLDLVFPGRHQVHQPARHHIAGFRRLTSSGRWVAMPQLQLPAWQLRHRWQPSASSAAGAQYTPHPPPGRWP